LREQLPSLSQLALRFLLPLLLQQPLLAMMKKMKQTR
jgi:hypothetical protein